ncbi:hypothetical protein DL93DRAFT_2145682 [Clavulina sp. PMI_390]|nr:hypothetical protein DL93DRAFT_2145682 [Clavulina sp. PMI_390]
MTLSPRPEPSLSLSFYLVSSSSNACDDGNCEEVDHPADCMLTWRWYQALGTRANAAVIMIGEDRMGAYTNNPYLNNPTYEFFSSVGTTFFSQFLNQTLLAIPYPLTCSFPLGNCSFRPIGRQSCWIYPQRRRRSLVTSLTSAATVLLPLTPENNYEATVLFCGGSNIAVDAWNPATNVIIDIPADSTCVRISPDGDAKWEDDTSLPEGRTMGNFILLPNGTILLLNSGGMGTAGYGTQDWTVGESYATAPIHAPLIYYSPNRTFSRVGLGNSKFDRLYHSTALLLPDGSVLVAGSDPHADYTINTTYPTEYRWELFFPWYYFERRPEPAGLLS